MKIIFKKQSEFCQFDYSILKYPEGLATSGENFSFCKYGNIHPKVGNGWCIAVRESTGYLDETVWELPTVLSLFIDWQFEHGRKDQLRELKNVLQL